MDAVQDATARLAREGKRFFTTQDLALVLELTPARAQQLAFRMAEAGIATRLKKGTYALLPVDAWGEPGATPTNWFEAAAALVDRGPYYLAYYTAMRLHRMTQHPLRTLFIAVTKPQRNVALGPVDFKFVVLARRRFFGEADHILEPGHVVKTTDLERTFIDCVDRLDLCGGIEEVVRGFKRRQNDLNGDRLLRHVMRLREPALTKRLGFMLELTGLGQPQVLWELERIAGRVKRYVPLDKTREDKTGDRNKRWELVINVDVDELLEVGKT